MKTQGTGQRKKKTGFVPYDYESAFEHSCEMLAADEVARLLRDRKKCVHATKEIRAGNQLEVEIYPEFTKLPATIPRKKNTAAQKDLNDRNSQKECVRTINENFGPRDLWCTFTYRRGCEPLDYDEALNNMRNYIRRIQRRCALPGFVDSKNEEKTERNAGYLVVSHSGGGMLRQGTRKGIRRTPANRGMRAHRIVKSLDISEDVCHGLCP